jgi:uncharacterized protein YjeT (DUF2065 family)
MASQVAVAFGIDLVVEGLVEVDHQENGKML